MTSLVGACLHGSGGPQVGEVTLSGGVNPCLYNLTYGHPTYHANMIKLKWEIIWTGGLPHLSGLPHSLGATHLHVNRPLEWTVLLKPKISRSNWGCYTGKVTSVNSCCGVC